MSNIVKIQNVEHLTAMIKAIVPRSFEKTFGGLSTNEVVAGFAFCATGLSQTELNTGLAKIQEMGYCPDPAMFAKWCKGKDGFDNTDAIADSYVGKSAALSNIIQWHATNQKTAISVAEKQAYDKSYHLWNDIQSQNDKHKAENAFKDFYQHIVNELVKARTPCQPYQAPIAVTQSEPKQAPMDIEQGKMAGDEVLANLRAMMGVVA